MRSVDAQTITQAFLATRAPGTDARFAELLAALARHLHDFTRETKLTHAEWRRAIAFLTEAGRITTEERNEFVLLSDVLGLSSLVDMLHSPPGGTPSSVLGPFHILGAPELPHGGDLKGDLPGPTVVVAGRIRDVSGAPVAGAAIEVWQTAPNGLYSNQDPAMDPFALRARLTSRDDGAYLFSTAKPAPYTVPTDGPVGDLLRGMGRHPWRPAHFHVIVTADGYRTLVTEVFPDDDQYLDADAVFGVRRALCVPLVEVRDAAQQPADLARDPGTPFLSVDFDITLVAGDA